MCPQWKTEILDFCPSTRILLIGCKTDLRTDVCTLMELSNQKQTPIAYEQVRQKRNIQLVRDIVNVNSKHKTTTYQFCCFTCCYGSTVLNKQTFFWWFHNICLGFGRYTLHVSTLLLELLFSVFQKFILGIWLNNWLKNLLIMKLHYDESPIVTQKRQWCHASTFLISQPFYELAGASLHELHTTWWPWCK